MKTIRNKVYQLIASVALMTFVPGCDVLEQEPQSILEIDSFYATGSDAEMGIIGAYNRFFGENHIVGTYMILDMASDDLTTVPPKFGYLIENRDEMSPLNHGGTEVYFRAPWVTIANTNLFIEKVNELPSTAFTGSTAGTGDRKAEILGEAHFIRGVSYYYLAMLWNNVPLILNFPEGSLPEENQVPAATQAEVLAQAEADLRIAEASLPDALTQFSVNERRGRASKWAAKAFLSRLKLMQNNWQEVVTLSNEIINSNQYSIINPWTRIFLNEQNSNEAILEIQAERSPAFFNMGIHGWFYGNGEFKATDDAIAQYEKPLKDARYEFVIKDNKVTSKFLPVPLWADAGIERANLTMLRLAEVYFNKAEAMNELDYETNKQQVLDILNLIRARAADPAFANRFRPTAPIGTTGIAPLTLTDVDTQDKMRLAIRAEKRRELMFEGQRWLDLLRWDPTYAMNVVKTSDPGRLYLPIPESEITLNNGELSQNPGW
jgi:starch-binding outer membrane protein, SusD/RagB family